MMAMRIFSVRRKVWLSPDFGKQFRKDQANWSAGDGKISGLNQAGGITVIPALCGGIEHPNVRYAEVAIVVNAFLHAAKSIFRRKYLNTRQRRLCKYLLYGLTQRD